MTSRLWDRFHTGRISQYTPSAHCPMEGGEVAAITDVARLAGVSKSTASRALTGRGYVSESTRRRVASAAADIGYIASPNAASLVTGRTKTVGVVIPFVNRWFFGEVLEGIERALLASGYDLILYNLHGHGPERERIFDFFLARKRVDAVLAVGVELTAGEVDRLHALGKPVIGIGGPIPGAATFAIDDVAAAALATEHLLSLGHTRIVHFGGDQADQMDFSVHGKRLRGHRAAMRSAGLADEGFHATDMSVPGGHGVAMQVLGDPRTRPTAIFAACDEVAFGVMIAAQRLGVGVPADVSVIGIDGHDHAEMFGLTTVEQSPGDQAAQAVQQVMALLDEEAATDAASADHGLVHGSASHTTVPVRLVVRTSTTAPAR